MKVLGYILTAAAILVGADVFVKTASQTAATPEQTETAASFEISLHGTTGAPPPPPD